MNTSSQLTIAALKQKQALLSLVEHLDKTSIQDPKVQDISTKNADDHVCEFQIQMNGTALCNCGQVNSDQKHQLTLEQATRNHKPSFTRIPPELAIGIKHSNLLDLVQIGVNKHINDHAMQLILPLINGCVQQVCKYMTQYTFKVSTGLQFVVILLAEQCAEVPRIKIQEMFKCGTLTSAIRNLNDIKIQYRKQNLDRLIDKETLLSIETQCITIGEQSQRLDRDEVLITSIMNILDQVTDINQVSVQTRKRLAHIIQIIVRLAKRKLVPDDAHECTDSTTCSKCKREVRNVFVEQTGLKTSTAVKLIATSYELLSKTAKLAQLCKP